MRVDTVPQYPTAAATAVPAAVTVTPATPPPAASGPLTRSQSTPQMEPEGGAAKSAKAALPSPRTSLSRSTSPLHPPSPSLAAFAFARVEEAQTQALLAELRAPPISAPAAQVYSVTPAASAVPVGVAVACRVLYGLGCDGRVARLSLLLSNAHKSSAGEVYRAAAAYLFSANNALHRLECCVEAVDLSECKALDDAGWRREGILRGALVAESGARDGALYAILRADM